MRATVLTIFAVATAFLAPDTVRATNGYFKHGYGARSESMGGVGVALPLDGLTPATNPAGIYRLENRFDVGVTMFHPMRDVEFDTSGLGGGPSRDESRDSLFLIPELGMVRRVGEAALGLSVFGNGGMNTTYDRNVFDDGFYGPSGSGAPDTGELGVDLTQMMIAGTAAYRFGSRHDVGASLIVGYQRFEAYGLGNFQCFTKTVYSSGDCASGDPPTVYSSNLTDRGVDDVWGVGARVGWMSRISPRLSLGASYASKVYMQPFDKYSELFAEQGDFDIPANLAVGMAVDLSPRLQVALDVQRIFYSDVHAVGNTGPTSAELIGGGLTEERLLGSPGGIGFGWDDMTVFKTGLQYRYPSGIRLLGGLSYGESPIPDEESLFAILAPAVIETHLTAGVSYESGRRGGEFTVGYTHALRGEQNRTYSLGPASYSARVGMHQHALRINHAWNL